MGKLNAFSSNLDFKRLTEKLKPWQVLIIILSIYYLGFIPNDNEENYLQLAKAFFNPDWITDSFMFSESSGTRLLYQYIVGFFLKYFSFEAVTIFFRLVLIISFSYALSKIYKKIKFNNLCIAIHLVFFFLDQQSFFGGSWMLISVEAKGFAYLFALLALYQVLNKKDYLAIVFLVIATYFHVLVGFYMFSYLILTMLSLEKITIKSVKIISFKSVIYFAAISPFVIYLLSSIQVDPALKPSSDWIYTYYRNSHHTAIFKSLDYFLHNHLFGVTYAIIGLIILVSLKTQKKQRFELNVLYNFAIISLFITLLIVPISYFDKSGTFLKYYPYRINTVSTFLSVMLVLNWVYNTLRSKYLNKIYFILILLISISILPIMISRINKSIKYLEISPLDEVCNYISKNVDKKAIIFSSIEDFNLTRKMERSRFVSQKFVPADLSKIHEWYYRVEARENVLKYADSFKQLTEKYKIDYLLNEGENTKDYLNLIYKNETFYLYKIIDK